MILRNVTFENDLEFRDDHICTILAESPGLFASIVQSMSAMEEGIKPAEPFMFLEGENEIDPKKLLLLVTDPFHLDLNSKKNLTALYARLEENLTADPELRSEWDRLAILACGITEKVTKDLFADVDPGHELSFVSFLKESGVKFEFSPSMTFKERMLRLMDITAELMPRRLIVCCNIAGYCEESTWFELLKYACYLKIRLLVIDQRMPEKLYEHEIRWVIHENFDDEIRKG